MKPENFESNFQTCYQEKKKITNKLKLHCSKKKTKIIRVSAHCKLFR